MRFTPWILVPTWLNLTVGRLFCISALFHSLCRVFFIHSVLISLFSGVNLLLWSHSKGKELLWPSDHVISTLLAFCWKKKREKNHCVDLAWKNITLVKQKFLQLLRAREVTSLLNWRIHNHNGTASMLWCNFPSPQQVQVFLLAQGYNNVKLNNIELALGQVHIN